MSGTKQSTADVMSVREEKAAVRARLKAVRDEMSGDARAVLSKDICEAFLRSMPYRFAEKLLLYAPHGSETDVFWLLDRALSDGKTVYYPLTFPKGEMRFHAVTSLDELKKGRFGVLSPDGGTDAYLPENGAQTDVCVVPGLGFDTRGYRIGYGGGYYDRFLSHFAGIRVSLAFEAQVLTDEALPVEKRYDKKLDALYTEREVRVFGI